MKNVIELTTLQIPTAALPVSSGGYAATLLLKEHNGIAQRSKLSMEPTSTGCERTKRNRNCSSSASLHGRRPVSRPPRKTRETMLSQEKRPLFKRDVVFFVVLLGCFFKKTVSNHLKVQKDIPSDLSCATQLFTLSSDMSASLSWSQGSPRNLPPASLLEALCE